MSEPCGAEHPEVPGLLCDKPRPCYVFHWNDTAREQWPGPPIPVQESRRKQVDAMAGSIPRPRTTGPPTTVLEAKAEGMTRAMNNAPEEFKQTFMMCLHAMALERDTFTSDDVWEVLDDMGVDSDRRASVGPMMSSGAKQGWMEKTEERSVSGRPRSKARDGLKVWRSLLR